MTNCSWVLLYVKRWLAAPLQHPDGTLVERDKGTPQGSAVSPVLANLFMHFAFDLWMAREIPGCPFERYADDAVVHCKSRRQANTCASGSPREWGRWGYGSIPTRRGSSTARTATVGRSTSTPPLPSSVPPNIGGAAREEPVELMSTPNRIRTGDRLRESCETRRATNLLICRSFRAPGPPSETSLLFRIFRISSGCSGCNWGSAAKTRGLSPYPRGPRSPSLENGDTPRASEMLRRRPDGQADHRKARRVGRPARMLRAAGGSGYGGLLLRSWRGAGPVDRRRLRRHRGLWTGRSRGVHASHVLTQLQHVA